MLRLIFTCFFLFAATFLKAGDLPKLNLEIGKKYTIETIYHEDTSKVNPHREYDKKIFEFTPTGFDKNKGIYDVKLVITYYMHVVQLIQKSGMWMETDVYETGFPSNFSRPVVFMNKHLVPVTFKLSAEGEITAFDFSAYYNYKTLGDLAPMLGEGDQKKMEVEIRGMFFYTDEIRVPWYGSFKLRSNYTIIKENENSLEVKVNAIEKTDSIEQFKRKVLIDKTTGLILEDQLSYNWILKSNKSIIRYQKWIPVFSEKFEANQKTGESKYEKTVISNPNTAIRVTIQDSVESPKFIVLTYFDELANSRKSFKLEKDRNGVFNFQLYLLHFQQIYILSNSEETSFTNLYNLFLSPGDNLGVEIRKSSGSAGLVFNGIGSDENRVNRSIRNINNSTTTLESAMLIQPRIANQDSAFQILNKYKLMINPEIYIELGNNIIYNPYLWGKNLNPYSLNNLKVPICNTLAARNFIYLQFLKNYADSFMKQIGQSSSNLNPSIDQYEREYSFGQLLFPEPILTEYLASIVEDALMHGKWNSSRLLYDRYILASPVSARVLQTEKLYKELASFSPGSIFPVDSLTDIYGNGINFHKGKNKVFIIRTNFITNTNLVEISESWNQSKRDYLTLRDNITNVRIVFGAKGQRSKLKAVLALNSDERIVFLNYEDIFEGTSFFSLLLTGNVLILGRDGIILFNTEVDSVLLQNAVEKLQTPHFLKGVSNFSLKIIVLSLLGILILAGLAFIVYRQVSKRKFKRAELNRKMRELELTVIRTQMNPHFMYNCLNSIQNLVQKNQNEEAFTYLSKFASLVRQVLNNSKKEEIPLSKELESVKEYIELEQLRFDFDYKIEIQEGIDVNSIFVPPMLLQPFAENAILHGLLLKRTSRLLSIRILKEQAKIMLVIEDNGVGREAAGKSDQDGNGQGILLCRNRLSLLSEKTGIHYELKIDDLTDENLQPSGTRVSIGFVEEE